MFRRGKGEFIVLDADSLKQRYALILLAESAGFNSAFGDDHVLDNQFPIMVMSAIISVTRAPEHFPQYRRITYNEAIDELTSYIEKEQ